MDNKEIIDSLSELQKAMLLLAESNNNVPITGDTWFQKEIFLVAKNVPRIEEEASFDSDFFGPFSENAEEELEELEQEELVQRVGKKIAISNLGKEVAGELKKVYKKEELEMIEDFKKLLNDLNDEELLTLIYFSFPETTNESQVKQKIISNKIKNAISLYKKEKISFSKAAEIAGASIEQFMKMVK